ncbi:helix-turn-helix domain-containing protein [Kribbella sp. NBC_01245]|uniref:helix-turn-helix domain-containing protein n=1 Tax=Kribbella sp. NBC_01245 TaxID=2903578 RepID=UPI002E2809D4|nr:helix-turn-helix domain-containing protein [Kribbella sp. NBC_01245]
MTTYSAVRTTGIYCHPGCSATPLAENVQTFELAAAAEAAGYRACLRCRPYRVVGSVADEAPELVCRAVQLILAGTLDAGTETALGARLGVSVRHLRRLFHDHLGVTPDQFARSRRAHFARRLLDDTDLTIADVAFASGFGSLRQFNRAMQEVFRSRPRELRDRRRRNDRLVADGGLALRMPFGPTYDWDAMRDFLAERAIPGVESVEDGVYRRTIALDGAPGLLEIGPGGADHLILRAHLPYWEGVIHVAERAARLAGIDSGVPGVWGPFEVAVQTVVGDRITLGRLASTYGEPVAGLPYGLTHAFPSAEVLADSNENETVVALARAVARDDVRLDGSLALNDLIARLVAIPGVSATAADQIALRLGTLRPVAR